MDFDMFLHGQWTQHLLKNYMGGSRGGGGGRGSGPPPPPLELPDY